MPKPIWFEETHGPCPFPDLYDVVPAPDFVLTGTAPGSGGGSGGGPRVVSDWASDQLAADAVQQGTVRLGAGYRLMMVTVDKACRIRLYATAAQQAADLDRPIGTDPTGDHGLMFEYVALQPGSFVCNPLVDGASMETPPTSQIPITVQNRSGADGVVTVSFTHQITE